jgi:hypothetical protein
LLVVLGFVLPLRTSLGEEADPSANPAAHQDLKRCILSVQGSFQAAVGSYANLTMQKNDPESPLHIGTSAAHLFWEAGIGFYSLGITYNVQLLRSPIVTSTDSDGFTHEAYRIHHGVKVFYQISSGDFRVTPEGGYVYLREEASIYDPTDKMPDRYNEKYKDQNYSYGLEVGHLLAPVAETELWLYGRYVHENLDIRADNYWIGLHLFASGEEVTESNKCKPYLESVHSRLGILWTKRSDGRSEWFLTLSLGAAFGLL